MVDDCPFYLKVISIFLFLIMGGASCSTLDPAICGQKIRFKGSSSFSFGYNERLLVCGDPKTKAWEEIPLPWAESSLRLFLQSRGYYSPTFEVEKGSLLVDSGQLTRITRIEFHHAPDHFLDIQFRNIVGEPLRSELLDRIESAVKLRLKNLGYACPKLKTTAVHETGAITIDIESGPNLRMGEIVDESSSSLNRSLFSRFESFRPGDPAQQDALTLSERRAELDGVVVDSQYQFECSKQSGDSVAISHHSVVGEPRLLKLGLGFSTEELLLGQFEWKNIRAAENGSSISYLGYASSRKRMLKAGLSSFPIENLPRFQIDPAILVEHRLESTFNSTELRVEAPLGYRWDFEKHSLDFSLGANGKRIFTQYDLGTRAITLVSLSAGASWMSHDFELFQGDPRSGTLIELKWESMVTASDFSLLANLIRLRGTHLWSLNSVEPHEWVFGVRYGLASTSTPRPAGTSLTLPKQYLNTLGGYDNLRGFGRNELTYGGAGAPSSLFSSLELRYAEIFGTVEPLFFWDWGLLGNTGTTLDPVLYHSPGIGFRWPSFFGVFRSSLAHGYSIGSSSAVPDRESIHHFQVFVSYGSEF
jgi:outer membrane translocation and assembly module TamA